MRAAGAAGVQSPVGAVEDRNPLNGGSCSALEIDHVVIAGRIGRHRGRPARGGGLPGRFPPNLGTVENPTPADHDIPRADGTHISFYPGIRRQIKRFTIFQFDQTGLVNARSEIAHIRRTRLRRILLRRVGKQMEHLGQIVIELHRDRAGASELEADGLMVASNHRRDPGRFRADLHPANIKRRLNLDLNGLGQLELPERPLQELMQVEWLSVHPDLE